MIFGWLYNAIQKKLFPGDFPGDFNARVFRRSHKQPGKITPSQSSAATGTQAPTPVHTRTIPTSGFQQAKPILEENLTPSPTVFTPTKTPTTAPTATQTPGFTRTPTFDPASISTVTPSIPAQCPVENQALLFNTTNWFQPPSYLGMQPQTVLDFLNSGGTRKAVISFFSQKLTWIPLPAAEQDLTGDGVNELILADDQMLLVLGCNQGSYQVLLNIAKDDGWVRFFHFILPGDMNLDGVRELITTEQMGNTNVSHSVTVYAWDGSQFKSVIQGEEKFIKVTITDYASMYGASALEVQDVDRNGTLELILRGGKPFPGSGPENFGRPWRTQMDTYSWNGASFVLSKVAFSAPVYRFQAVQDGDRAVIWGDYAEALDFYQQAIFSDQLDWWSDERFNYLIRTWFTDPVETPIPTPTPDRYEYSYLAAYSRYRILLLHTLRGYLPEAETVLLALQQKFPQGQPGYEYAVLAGLFWDEYRTSNNLAAACNAAVAYASAHPTEILSYLGNGQFARTGYGNQSLEYKPRDICPFR